MADTDAVFWADQLAEKVVDTFPDDDIYVCASGISPSGAVHIGNFREIITTDFVVKSLERMGRDVRFIYSWDDYDRFRKVPAGVPDDFEQHIGKPLSAVPDPDGCHDSYAAHFEAQLEDEIGPLHMGIDFIRQTQMFQDGKYAALIKQAMNNREKIRDILDQYRNEPLDEDWWPLRVYCPHCGKDFTAVTDYDGDYTVTYECEECDDTFTLNFSEDASVKPPWRVDWPMRWAYEQVNFEPGGKDHSAAGSSRDTGTAIVEQVYDRQAPVYQMYEFVNLKGEDGKMSSSSGDVLTPGELLEIYTPALLRFLFAETKPTRDFAIALDEDIIQRYDKFDEIEDAYFNPEKVDNDRQLEHWNRVYELSIVEVPDEQPVRIDFDHAAFVAQTIPRDQWETDGIDVLRQTGHIDGELTEEQKAFILQRMDRADTWAQEHGPETYTYEFNEEVPDDVVEQLSDGQIAAMHRLRDQLEEQDFVDKDELEDRLFGIAKSDDLDVGVGGFFQAAYLCLLSREQGPRLADFILTRGQDEIVQVLKTLD
jgi:lysyl-tRNA synthetase class 1